MLAFLRHTLGLNWQKPPKAKPRYHRGRRRVGLGVEELENRLVPAVTFTVDTLADTHDMNPGDGQAQDMNNHTSLRAAIEEGNALKQTQTDVTINFDPMVFPPQQGQIGGPGGPGGGQQSQTIVLGSALETLENNFSIQGPGASALTVRRDINAATRFRIFFINSNMTCWISGLTISGGDTSEDGGGVANSGDLTLTNCVLTNNHTDSWGGGVSNDGTLLASSCTVQDNTTGSDGAGGGFFTHIGSLSLRGCLVQYNNALSGAGVYVGSGTLEIGESSTISYNPAGGTGAGGGIYVGGGTFTMSGGSVTENSAHFGGGIYFSSDSSTSSTLTGVSITSNNANRGGGWYIQDGAAPTFDTCTLSNNTATTLGPGGAYEPGGDWTPINCTFTDAIAEDP
jgi:hypothetical protein